MLDRREGRRGRRGGEQAALWVWWEVGRCPYFCEVSADERMSEGTHVSSEGWACRRGRRKGEKKKDLAP